MAALRKPLQGTTNIVRFNYPVYILSFAAIGVLAAFAVYNSGTLGNWILAIALLGFLSILVSLMVSLYVYDLSGLYKFNWFPKVSSANIVNINAGFDETSALLQEKYPYATLKVLDFYDPNLHTEPSIKRARKLYPPFPGTISVTTKNVQLAEKSADIIFCLFAAHEIRQEEERILFFTQLKLALAEGGQIIVTEHLRNAANFLAYNIGAMHFHSEPAWLRCFAAAGLSVNKIETKTAFVYTFFLSAA